MGWHEMVLVSHSDCESEWRCLICGRQMVIVYGVGINMLVIGDSTVTHYGNNNRTKIKLTSTIDSYLEPFARFFEGKL